MTVGLAPRRAALEALRAVDGGAWSTRAVPDAIAGLDDPRDRALAAHLAHGTLRWQGTLDWELNRALSRDLAHVEHQLVPILRLGAFQLGHSRVPARAAVDTSVALARQVVPGRRAKGAGGFVNGVLRGLGRMRDDIDAAIDGLADVDRIALRTAHPRWVVRERLDAGMTAATTEALLVANNEPPGLTLRANDPRDDVLAGLRASAIEAEPTTHSASGIRAPGADPRTLDVVANGRAVPQDEASMLVVDAMPVVAGDTVLDLCAAPGGKATHLAQRVGESGTVIAVELHPHRARLVTESARRQHVAVEVVVGDALEVALPSDADAVLVDAPCTGLGTGRRRPEVRWNRAPSDMSTLADLQVRLVTRALDLVRDGGHVTYSVCTWTAQETTGVVARIEGAATGALERIGQRQLQPDVDGTDGMFMVTWRVGTPPAPVT